MISAASIIEKFNQYGWHDNDPMEQMLQLRRENPDALADLIDLALKTSTSSETFLHAALDLMSDELFVKVVQKMLEIQILQTDEELKQDILEIAALHYPHLFSIENELPALHNEKPWHIAFNSEQYKFLTESMPEWHQEITRLHPTWHVCGEEVLPAQMGGNIENICGLCHKPLHRLMFLHNPSHVGISNDTELDFATCLSCLGWEDTDVLFYKHDERGHPSAHTLQCRADALEPQFPSGPLLFAEVQLFVAPERWRRQDWAISNNRQNLSRIGGAPSWIQEEHYPNCPDCEKYMLFVM